MTGMRRLPALAALLALGLGCNSPIVEPTTGSETHWLARCPVDGCGPEADCQCGVCTAACAGDADCGGGVCVSREDAPAVCGPAESVCLAACDGPGDCGLGLECVAGHCVGAPGARRTAPLKAKVDLLFVIDDSGSMCEEQFRLGAAMAEVAPVLVGLDWRLAVVSTDLQDPEASGRFLARPAPAVAPVNCLPDFAPDTADCPDDLEPILSSLQAGTADVIATRFRCMVALGTSGYGFEMGLEAMRRSLSCRGPNAAALDPCCVDGQFDPACAGAPAFLRPDAGLVVVVVSDEDDCSDHAAAGLDTERPACRAAPADAAGFQAGLATEARCAGLSSADCLRVVCGEASLADCWAAECSINQTVNANCYWDRERLTPVAEFAEFLRGQKADPEALAYWPYHGRPLRAADGSYGRFVNEAPLAPACERGDPAYAPDVATCCRADGTCPGEPFPVCDSALGEAFPGNRYAELGDLLGAGACVDGDPACSLCAEDIELSTLAADRIPRAVSAVCLDRAPTCGEASCGPGSPVADMDLVVTVDDEPVAIDGWRPRWGAAPTCPFAVVLVDALRPGQTLETRHVGR